MKKIAGLFFFLILSVNIFAVTGVRNELSDGTEIVGIALSECGDFQMAQNFGYAGPTENVHNGTDNVYWTASATSGPAGLWGFDSTGRAHTGSKSIDFSSTLNSNQMQVATGNYISTSNVVFQGYIYITSWTNDDGSDIKIQCYDTVSGLPAGNNVSLKDFINTGRQNTWVKFNVPLNGDGFGLEGDFEVDAVRITMQGSAPANVPDGNLDDMRFLSGGDPRVFEIKPRPGHVLFLTKLKFVMTGNTASTFANSASNPFNPLHWPGMSTPLDNGFVFQQIIGGETASNVVLKNLDDILAIPEVIIGQACAVADNKILFYGWLDRGQITILRDSQGDVIKYILQDDYSSLDSFRITYIAIEVKET